MCINRLMNIAGVFLLTSQWLFVGSIETKQDAEIFKLNSTPSSVSTTRETPSLTSVHQVWTSSTGGSIDELSPDLIGKLRKDVSFLAAYAMRPRLIGASTSSSHVQDSGVTENLSVQQPSTQVQAPSTRPYGDQEQAGSSWQSSKLQASLSSPVSGTSIAGLSEYNVETSSTSKTEHHHRKKTTLKRDRNSSPSQSSSSSRLALRPSTIKRGKKSTATKLSKKVIKKRTSKGLPLANNRSVNRLLDNLRGSKPLVRRKGLRVYSQSQRKSSEKNVDNSTKTKVSGSGTKRLFYESIRPVKGNQEPIAQNDVKSKKAERDSDVKESGIDGQDELAKSPEEDEPVEDIPRRVGDPDVDEVEGDTVLVEPKSDGIDDDPEIPEDYDDNNQTGGLSPGTLNGKKDDIDKMSRQDPTETNSETEIGSAKDVDGNRVGTSLVGGVGVGATVDSAPIDETSAVNETPMPQGGVSRFDKEVEGASDVTKNKKDGFIANGVDDEDEQDRDNGPKDDEGGIATDTNELDINNTDDNEGDDHHESSVGGKANTDGLEDEGRKFDTDNDYNHNTGAVNNPKDGTNHHKIDTGLSKSTPSDDGSRAPKAEDTDDPELDYRDDDEIDQKRKNKHHHPKGHQNSECHNNDTNHDHNHNDHHDGIKWLEEAIPGEPGIDYPILSKINTGFNCEDQKYPGYYADVEAKCQMFHICQKDGRQDSFLCPNGTIFNQLTMVCVWWNSFECEATTRVNANINDPEVFSLTKTESHNPLDHHSSRDERKSSWASDAPKYYDINARLYKTPLVTSSVVDMHDDFIMPAMKPRDGIQIDTGSGVMSNQPKGSPSTSIDSLIKDMHDPRQRALNDGNVKGLFGSNQEGDSVQNISTSLDEVGRKKRASVRQAPPKLKPRRVSRNLRRRKLRHNPKPKRRA